MKLRIVYIFLLNFPMKASDDDVLTNLKSNLKSTLADLKNKLKSNFQIKPKVELSPVGPRPGSYLDFPGRNRTRVNLIRDEWNEYYACLKLQEQVLGKDKIFNPEARLVIAGTNVKIDCNICVSPADSGTKVKWFYSPKLTTNLSAIVDLDSDNDVVVSSFDSTLHLLNIQQTRSGMYLCKHSDSFIAPVYIEVVFKEPIVKVTPKNYTKYQVKPLSPLIRNLNVFIKWENWSPCSACDIVGKKLRLGYCYVYQENNEIFRLFEDGVPCRSQLLNDEIKADPNVQNTPSELMVTYCKEKCQNNQIFKVTDEFGNVLETANNSAGYYSLLQDVPQVSSSIKTQTLTTDEFTSVIVICPGYSYENMDESSPIEWQISNKLLVPKILSDQTRGRIEIDPLGRLTFNQLWIVDSKIYSCWQNKELLGLVKLQVIQNQRNSPQIVLSNHLFTFIALCLTMTFLYVAVRVYLTKKPQY
ncbi:hypothetical protein M8J75_003364 [Diaphorina citri]|nr:hypothetical protein M8J75_003364 [Diaphorina citri]